MRIFYSLLVLLATCSASYAQLNMQFRSQLTYPGLSLANIWGYVDSLGNEYALVGTSNGVSIVDVTDPVNPIQKYAVAGTVSSWREIKTWGKHAYVTTEGCCLGLQIINLSNLPGPVTTSYWTGSGAIAGQLQRLHSLHIEDGYAYLNGSNLFGGACIIASLANPAAPVYMSNTQLAFTSTTRYVHDCYVRNDTMFGANIYAGMFTIINVADKSNPILVSTQNTTTNFTHNCWLSDDGRTLFTTDETSNSYLTAYDISDPGNIINLDKVQTTPGSNSIVHNTYVKNDYAVTSWYKDGVAVVDVSRPQNMIVTGFYDTYSQGTGSGFSGCWGVYPYLPSGNIIASDINNGLFVMTPTYIRACYLEGSVTNSCTGVGVSGVTVQITGSNSDVSTVTGSFKTGTPTAGSYTVVFSKAGFNSTTITNVSLTNGNVTSLAISLVPINGITAVNASVNHASCNGMNDGSSSISVSGGTSPFSYAWSNGSTMQSATGLAAGTYTATVADATGCSSTASVTVSQPAAVMPSASSNSPLCDGSALNFTAAAGFSNYAWTGPGGFASSAQNPSIGAASGGSSGNYMLTVEDANGCEGSTVVSVQVSDIVITESLVNATCFNTATGSIDVSVNSGIGAYSYLWSNNATTQDLASKKAGNYTVTVTDGIGCSEVKSYTLTQSPSALLLSTSKTNIRCPGTNTGLATVNPSGGLAPYSYSWNTVPVKTTASITGLAPGSYTVNVTDAAGCIKSTTVTITQPPLLIVNTSQTNVTFPGGNNGSGTVFPSGGTPPYTFLWNTIPPQFTSSVTNLTAGVYKCTVTDSKSCKKNISFTITEPFSVKPGGTSGRMPDYHVFPNPAKDLVTISGLDEMSESEIYVYDVTGRIVYHQVISSRASMAIEVGNLERGLYLFSIRTKGSNSQIKVVLQ